MPLYDYHCKKCEHEFTKMLKIADRKQPESESCPNCNEVAIELTIGAPVAMSPFRLDGGVKPTRDFKERMKQIKNGFKYDRSAIIKDY